MALSVLFAVLAPSAAAQAAAHGIAAQTPAATAMQTRGDRAPPDGPQESDTSIGKRRVCPPKVKTAASAMPHAATACLPAAPVPVIDIAARPVRGQHLPAATPGRRITRRTPPGQAPPQAA